MQDEGKGGGGGSAVVQGRDRQAALLCRVVVQAAVLLYRDGAARHEQGRQAVYLYTTGRAGSAVVQGRGCKTHVGAAGSIVALREQVGSAVIQRRGCRRGGGRADSAVWRQGCQTRGWGVGHPPDTACLATCAPLSMLSCGRVSNAGKMNTLRRAADRSSTLALRQCVRDGTGVQRIGEGAKGKEKVKRGSADMPCG